MGEDAIIACVAMGFFTISAYFRHTRKMLELKLAHNNSLDNNMAAELRSIKDQLVDLRDTTTRFDMSFDAALQRLETRLTSVETRTSSMSVPAVADYHTTVQN